MDGWVILVVGFCAFVLIFRGIVLYCRLGNMIRLGLILKGWKLVYFLRVNFLLGQSSMHIRSTPMETIHLLEYIFPSHTVTARYEKREGE